MHLRHQREAEFASLSEGQTTAPCGFTVTATPLHQQRHHDAFDDHQADSQPEDQQAVGDEQLQVDQHADADKKHPEQNVAEGPDIGFDLMPVMAFTQQHAGQKSTQGGRQTEQVSQPRGKQHNHQCQQHK